MKKLIILFLLFFAIKTNGQTPTYTKIGATLYQIIDGDTIPISEGSHSFSGSWNKMYGAIKDTNATNLPVLMYNNANKKVYKGVVSGGGGTPSLTNTFFGIGNSSNQLSGSADFSYNTGKKVLKLGVNAGLGNNEDENVFIGFNAGSGNYGSNNNLVGSNVGLNNGGVAVNGMGTNILAGNTANFVNAFGFASGTNNTFSHITLLGRNASADGNSQLVFSNEGLFSSRLDFSGITAARKFTFPDKSGTVAMLSDIPSGASDIFNEINTGLTTTNLPIANFPEFASVRIYKNGIRLRLDTDYTVNYTTGVITLTTAAISGDTFIKDYKANL